MSDSTSASTALTLTPTVPASIPSVDRPPSAKSKLTFAFDPLSAPWHQ